jgi:PAS domain S-box-containing protein
MPERSFLALSLLLLYIFAFAWLFYWQRSSFRRLSGRQRVGFLLLVLAGFAGSQFLSISVTLPGLLPRPGVVQNPQTVLALLSAIPLVLAAAYYPPPMAFLVGFATGLSRTFWQSHHLFEPLYFALAALLVGSFLQQRYRGRLNNVIRHPIAAGLLGLLLGFPLLGLATLSYATGEVETLVALDWALSTTWAQLLPLAVEALVGGFVLRALWIAPELRPDYGPLVSSITGRSLRNRLLVNFGLLSVVVASLLLMVVFLSAKSVATRLAISEMAQDASAVADEIPDFRNQLQNLLRQYGQNQTLLGSDEEAISAELAQLARSGGAYYRRVVLVDDAAQVRAYYPDQDVRSVVLTAEEEAAIGDALSRALPSITAAQETSSGVEIVSIVVPVINDDGQAEAALIGRIPGIALGELVGGIQNTVGAGTGFIVDEQNHVVAHPDETSLLTTWVPAVSEEQYIRARPDLPGFAYEGRSSDTNARELVYFAQGPDHPWTVVVTLPYAVVLGLALEISAPLLLALLPILGLVGMQLYFLSGSISSPLRRLVQASQQLASGNWDAAVPVDDEGEIGQLAEAFERMRRSMQQQFNDKSLMLQVSQDISTSIDIEHGIPTILRGILRGTGAAGVRAIVLSPTSRHPLTFAEGPVGDVMASFDRQIAVMARQQEELILNTPEQIRHRFDLPAQATLPVQAMVAVTLYSKSKFQGVLWLGYRQPRVIGESELGLLRTLAGQASVLVENAYLYATAEGQRRRLTAVLASTSDAFVVTDQTNRILFVNPAMERLFNLDARAVTQRPVADVIPSRPLVAALTEREERVRNLEIPGEDGRTFYAGVSTIVRADGQVVGRVGVLHDITQLKELDQLKSEFVATVSHDLRSPLTFMRGYLTMLSMVGEINERQQGYVEKILGGVEQISRIIDDLLDLGRIEAGVELMVNDIEVPQLLTAVVAEHADLAAEQGLDLQVMAPPELPFIRGDAPLVRRAVANLVSNAVKYAPHSGVVLVRAQQDGDDIIFSVHDRGPGIPQKDQIRLFEKFYRVRQKDQDNSKGSGLGLAIVKSIVQRHGGRVWVHSQEGKGSSFYFSLPVRCEEQGKA